MLPHFIVIGGQKCASTFLHRCLAEHPDIWMPEEETPFFESPDYEQGSMADLERMFGGRKERVLGMKRPNYLGKPEVAPRIRQHLPEVKLIAVLRNPVDRAVAAYHHYVSHGYVPVRGIERGMRCLLNGEYDRRFRRAREIIEFGFYHKHLERFAPLDPGELMHVLLYDDIVRDRSEVIARLFRFLGVDDTFLPAAIDSRPQAVVYSLPRLWLRAFRNALLHRYSPDRTRSVRRDARELPARAAALLDRMDARWFCRWFANRSPGLSPELRRRLEEVYADDVRCLQIYLGRTLAAWGVGLERESLGSREQ